MITFQKSFVGEQSGLHFGIIVGGDKFFSVGKINAKSVAIIDVDVKNISERHGNFCARDVQNNFGIFFADCAEDVLKSFCEVFGVIRYRLDEITDGKDAVAVQNKIVAAREENNIGVVVAARANDLRKLQAVDFGHANIQDDEPKTSGLEGV